MTRICLILTAAALACAGVAGCRQHYLTVDDTRYYNAIALKKIETPQPYEEPPASFDFGPLTTVNNPEGRDRPITLAECITLALENGRTGDALDRGQGFLSSDQQSASNLTDAIRVFAFDPAIVGTDIEESLAKFDARWETSMVWQKVDRPIGTALETFQAANTGRQAIQQDIAQFRAELVKPLPSGGVAGITFRTDYEFSNLSPRVNPAYRPAIEFGFEHPLLQGHGVGINQIRGTHPGSLRSPFPTGGRVPGILLTRIAYDQTQVEFDRRVQEMLFTVEQAYWNLWGAYRDLVSRETAMNQAHLLWHTTKIQFQTGGKAVQDLARAEEQYQLFRLQRVQALGRGPQVGFTGRQGVLEAERRLRYLIGLPPEDGSRLQPIDEPTVAPFDPSWGQALTEAMNKRPELIQIRQAIHASQLAVLREQDFAKPDLRVFGSYDITALGNHLDGHDQNSALASLADGRFNNWTFGIRFDTPIGQREAHAEVTKAKLRLASRMAFLRDQEQRVAFSVLRSIREIAQTYQEITIQRARREAAATQLRAAFERFKAGQQGSLEVVLEAQRNWADALRDEQFAIADYNVALVSFEREKGTIMQHDNVVISEGPLPICALGRASEHIRERTRAVHIKDAPAPAPGVELLPLPLGDPATLPPVGSDQSAPLPRMLDESKNRDLTRPNVGVQK